MPYSTQQPEAVSCPRLSSQPVSHQQGLLHETASWNSLLGIRSRIYGHGDKSRVLPIRNEAPSPWLGSTACSSHSWHWLNLPGSVPSLPWRQGWSSLGGFSLWSYTTLTFTSPGGETSVLTTSPVTAGPLCAPCSHMCYLLPGNVANVSSLASFTPHHHAARTI